MGEGEMKPAVVVERRRYPLVPLKDVVVFPSMIVPLNVARSLSMKAVEAAMAGHDGKIVLVVQRNATVEEPGPSDLYEVGCLAEILKVFKSTDKALKVGAEGVERIKIAEFVLKEGYYEVGVDPFEDKDTEVARLEVLWKTVQKQFDDYSRLSRRIPIEVVQSIPRASFLSWWPLTSPSRWRNARTCFRRRRPTPGWGPFPGSWPRSSRFSNWSARSSPGCASRWNGPRRNGTCRSR
jgi:hypothetical protein